MNEINNPDSKLIDKIRSLPVISPIAIPINNTKKIAKITIDPNWKKILTKIEGISPIPTPYMLFERIPTP